MSWNTKQSHAIEFLKSLELFGTEKQFPLRVLDSIRELKADVEKVSDELALEQILLQVSPLLKHMGKKYPDLAKTKIIPMDGIADTVTMEEVADRIKEIIYNCISENQQRAQIYAAEQTPAVLELERKLKEIQDTKSHYEDIKNAGRFQRFCRQTETDYNTRVSNSLSSYADMIWQNCDAAIGRIKSVLTKLKDKRVHVSESDFWNAFGNKTDLVKQRIRSMAAKVAKQHDSVNGWAASLILKLNESRKELIRNRLIGIAAPLVLVIGVMLILRLGGGGESSAININWTENGISVENVTDVVGEIIAEVFNAASDQLYKIITPFLYFLVYIPLVIKLTKKGFCNKVAGYLVPDMEKFLKETDFQGRLEAQYESINTEAEQACQEILSDILSGTEITDAMQVRSESEEFMVLCGQWETIYRMA